MVFYGTQRRGKDRHLAVEWGIVIGVHHPRRLSDAVPVTLVWCPSLSGKVSSLFLGLSGRKVASSLGKRLLTEEDVYNSGEV